MGARIGIALRLDPFGAASLGPRDPVVCAAFDVVLQGLTAGERVELIFWEKDDPARPNPRPDRQLGTAAGKAAPSKTHPGLNTVILDGAPPAGPQHEAGKPPPIVIAFRFPEAVGGGPAVLYIFALAVDRAHQHEGDDWQIAVQSDNLNLLSPTQVVAHVRRELLAAEATYRPRRGSDLTLYHDGSTDLIGGGGAFFDMLAALKLATKFVFIADWSFHPLFRPSRLGPAAVADPSNSIGALLLNKAAAGALVAIHAWDHTAVGKYGAPDPQNDSGGAVFESLIKKLPNSLLWRASSHDNTGMSHHQKFVVMDQPGPDGKLTLRVFFGGLDLTKGRFDNPGHPILPTDGDAWPFRQQWHTPNFVAEHTVETDDGNVTIPQVGYDTDEWYNAEFGGQRDLPRQPWHDIYGSATGPLAWDFVREFVGRWTEDPTWNPTHGDNSGKGIKKVQKVFRDLFDSKVWYPQWKADAGPFAGQLYRSIIKSHWGGELAIDEEVDARAQGRMQELHWPLTVDYEKSIQRAYRQAIQQADEYIYIETQYFIGSGKQWGEDAIGSVENDLPAQIVERIKQRRADGVPFHVYIVTPMYPEGSPVDGSILEQRWLEWRTMEWMLKELGDDWYKSLSFYFLANWNTVPAAERRTSGTREEMVRAHKRYMIYVHSKLMMVDDRYIIFGSANLNERSLAGNRDTEIASAFWPLPGKEDDCVKKLRDFRLEVWKEHLKMDASGFGQDASKETSWKKLQSAALENYKSFRSFQRAETDGHLCRLPLALKNGHLSVVRLDLVGITQLDQIPDAPPQDPDKALKSGWGWSSPGAWLMRKLHVAE